ncbi:MAG: substrate-binding domain-containing protein [Ruminococcus sp.]|nr:substrate-binding domain-containing protein [Ruminococcus sp.]
MKKSISIGIITAQAADSEQRQLLCGIIDKAQNLGMNSIILSNIYNSSEYFADVEVENRIYDQILSKHLDGIILTGESFLNTDLQQRIYSLIKQRTDIPVIITGAEIEGFDCLNNDVRADTKDIIDHLIEAHGFTKIDFLTGPAKYDTSLLRVEGYKDSLHAHGIPFSEERIIYGDYWMNSGEKLADDYINGRRTLPEAVACANDYMAYGLCDRLMENGISIPEKITVTGYEYVGSRCYHTPILTTYLRNRTALGSLAAAMIYNRITGRTTPLPDLRGHIVLGDSCACCADNSILCNELSAIRREMFFSRMNLTGNFEQQLTVCRSVSDYVGVLQEFVYLIRDLKGLYLCLHDNWCSIEQTDDPLSAENSDSMICHTIMRPDGNCPKPVVFRSLEELPPVICPTDKELVLYNCPIFFSGKYFGYFILQYDHADSYDIIFRDWLKIAASALELLRMKNDINTLLECRDLSVQHDSATGMLNEKGIENELCLLKSRSTDEELIGFILIRTAAFSDDINIDSKKAGINLDRKIASILTSQCCVTDLCGKISERTYAFIRTALSSDDDFRLLADRLSTLILYSEQYRENFGRDSVILCSRKCLAKDFDYSFILKDLLDEADNKLYERSLLHRNPYYPVYSGVRELIYSTPSINHNSEDICKSLTHSEGYFRSVYKDLFGISFHQDLIRSRISLSKYLILTSSMSIEMIAESCGYVDSKHFYHQFRKLTGVSPRKYKLSDPSGSIKEL